MVDVALLTDADQDDNNEDKVSMMTIHSAKGLEFPFVFIVGLEENLFPSQMALNSREELEEERRLFYVALTRARSLAYLSYATTRFRWGLPVFNDQSRFIAEVAPEFLDRKDLLGPGRRSSGFGGFRQERQQFMKGSTSWSGGPGSPEKDKSPSSPPADFSAIQPGMEVLHERFGKGKVLGIEGEDDNLKATIFFPSAGQKQLLLRFAKLTLV
jgi:DNA helicase-2/ATP-dependent DNA helicase PcrA